ncbi:MAG: hypothetical protein A4E52_00699 [Pelotomaculum sp. PtaB.Bin013]|uniref:Uncharacterized protein n=1 Tax=Pelotomaculum isophthalicicum JI TaxID=947010 RepID=A0A9X4JVB3_9FIRM|nr:hypothetical protein [Pelotomaculum isophthalicicum]MDF9407198.1 hypothetical protein [Pelotomaculum isophthalicicum JI]OPX90842.1 MAG: hypothetical protein A4E52_00699 [Pelotomaculum sp. PtaB.Bin013]
MDTDNRGKATLWHYQDVLQLSVNQWEEALKNPLIFDNNALRMVQFVYNQNNCKSTASEIAEAMSTSNHKIHYNSVCAYNRKVAKALYNKYEIEPPIDENGEKRYWNVIFDGEPEEPQDQQGHFYWKLRPNLVIAFGNLFA